MNRRVIFSLFAIALGSTLPACGSEEPAREPSSIIVLDGTYRPTQAGAIGSITFSNGRDYYLVPSGCTGGGCVEIGTYRLDAQTSTVVLTRGESGREKTIRLENVKTSDAAAALVKTFVGTRDLTEPEEIIRRGQQTNGGQQRVSGDQQQQLNEGGQQGLAEKIVDLVKTIVEAVMNQQNMKKDDEQKDDEDKADEKQDDDEPKPNPFDCKQGVPTNDSTPAEKLAYAARCPNGP